MRYLMMAVLGMLVLLVGVTATNPAYAHPGGEAEGDTSFLHGCTTPPGGKNGRIVLYLVDPATGVCSAKDTAIHIPLVQPTATGGDIQIPGAFIAGTGSTRYADGFVESTSTTYEVRNTLEVQGDVDADGSLMAADTT